MKDIKKMVEDAIVGAVTDSDVEQAVENIVEDIDFVEMLSENDALKDIVFANVASMLDEYVEMYL